MCVWLFLRTFFLWLNITHRAWKGVPILYSVVNQCYFSTNSFSWIILKECENQKVHARPPAATSEPNKFDFDWPFTCWEYAITKHHVPQSQHHQKHQHQQENKKIWNRSQHAHLGMSIQGRHDQWLRTKPQIVKVSAYKSNMETRWKTFFSGLFSCWWFVCGVCVGSRFAGFADAFLGDMGGYVFLIFLIMARLFFINFQLWCCGCCVVFLEALREFLDFSLPTP